MPADVRALAGAADEFHAKMMRYREALERIAAVKPDAIQWVEQNHYRLNFAVKTARNALGPISEEPRD